MFVLDPVLPERPVPETTGILIACSRQNVLFRVTGNTAFRLQVKVQRVEPEPKLLTLDICMQSAETTAIQLLYASITHNYSSVNLHQPATNPT